MDRTRGEKDVGVTLEASPTAGPDGSLDPAVPFLGLAPSGGLGGEPENGNKHEPSNSSVSIQSPCALP